MVPFVDAIGAGLLLDGTSYYPTAAFAWICFGQAGAVPETRSALPPPEGEIPAIKRYAGAPARPRRSRSDILFLTERHLTGIVANTSSTKA
jgi:hypothetical protein